MDESKPLPAARSAASWLACAASCQGLTFVHYFAQRKHISWDALGAWFPPCLLDRETWAGVIKTA